jgi:hypothetical protein
MQCLFMVFDTLAYSTSSLLPFLPCLNQTFNTTACHSGQPFLKYIHDIPRDTVGLWYVCVLFVKNIKNNYIEKIIVIHNIFKKKTTKLNF